MEPRLQESLAAHQITFKFNPPTLKMALQAVSKDIHLTVLIEVESILNVKPSGYVSSVIAYPDPYPMILADHFWSQFIRHYLPTLQVRQKWKKSTKNLAHDTVVMTVDLQLPRANWPVGRVVKLWLYQIGRGQSKGPDLPTPVWSSYRKFSEPSSYAMQVTGSVLPLLSLEVVKHLFCKSKRNLISGVSSVQIRSQRSTKIEQISSSATSSWGDGERKETREVATCTSVRSAIHLASCSEAKPILCRSKVSARFGFPLAGKCMKKDRQTNRKGYLLENIGAFIIVNYGEEQLVGESRGVTPGVSQDLLLLNRVQTIIAAQLHTKQPAIWDVKPGTRENLEPRYADPGLQDFLHKSTASDPCFKSLLHLNAATRLSLHSAHSRDRRKVSAAERLRCGTAASSARRPPTPSVVGLGSGALMHGLTWASVRGLGQSGAS
ncbi:hypothetical protein N1851_021780 [Merluccius polli]|uniref:DUF5641 domain-containing protein n=1 Tax=Merluccius polli TaxID=89951 RepID=A0AA47NZ45_MERPO|nr:hypothetical protein N1851_021780 [Merluccius polli]